MAKALNTMRICVCRGPAGANRRTEERTLRLLLLGNSATKSAAIVVGIPMVPSFGSASINAVNRTTAASLGIRARLVASCQGSTLSRASAERTLGLFHLIGADRRAKEFIELWPNKKALGRDGSRQYPTPFVYPATRSQADAAESTL